MTPTPPPPAPLARARFEVIPMRGVDEELGHLPRDAVVTVTSSPTRGLDPTLALTERLLHRGYRRVVPHLAARSIRDRTHLRDLLQRLADLRVGEVFVVAGDAPEPAGPFDGSVALLPAMADLGHDLRIGITGYPESHARIPDNTTIDAMFAKERYADYIVSQICYAPAVTAQWVRTVRARGTTLPIHIGLPGVVDFARLLRISRQVGIGDSMRYLRTQWATIARTMGGYRPDALVDGLADVAADPSAGIAGWHLFTFNEVRATEAWRRHRLARDTRTFA